jgi:hypothetical protein
VIASSEAEHEQAVQTLESIRAESAGARDLKEACVNTYRGLIRATEAQQSVLALLVLPDGGSRGPGQLSVEERARGGAVARRHRADRAGGAVALALPGSVRGGGAALRAAAGAEGGAVVSPPMPQARARFRAVRAVGGGGLAPLDPARR